MNNNNNNLGIILRILRLANNLSILETSNISGLSTSYICELEKQKKNASTIVIEKLLKTFNIDKSQFNKLLAYYKSIEYDNELRKYQLTLIKSLEFILNNNTSEV